MRAADSQRLGLVIEAADEEHGFCMFDTGATKLIIEAMGSEDDESHELVGRFTGLSSRLQTFRRSIANLLLLAWNSPAHQNNACSRPRAAHAWRWPERGIAMHRERLILGCWVLTAVPGLLLAQGFDERSIPEPTELGSVALSPGAEIRTIGADASVGSRDSNAQIAAVEVRTANGKRQCGLRIALESSGRLELVYLAIKEAAQLREEFAGLDASYSSSSHCEAINMCVEGVARCRPSQTVRQAYCPSAYSTPQGEHGVYLSSHRTAFRFPLTPASQFVSAIDSVMAECNQQTASDSAQH